MKKIQFYLGILVVLLALSSCIKDPGNYNYGEIDNALNKLTIRLSTPAMLPHSIGGDSLVAGIRQGDTLVLIADIVSKDGHPEFNPDDYTYEWMAYNTSNPLPSRHPLSVRLGREKDLRLAATIPAAVYWVIYNVTHKETGMQYTERATLVVQDLVTTGWLVMCADDEGMMRIDIRTSINDTIQFISDVTSKLGYDNPYPPIKDPIKFFPIYGTDQFSPDKKGFYLLGKGNSYRVHATTLEYTPAWSLKKHFVTTVSDTLVAINMQDDRMTNIMVGNDGNLYFMNANQLLYFSTPVNVFSNGRRFNVAPYFVGAFSAFGASPRWVIFDTDAKSFRTINSMNGSVGTMPAGDIRSFENTGLDLVWMNLNIQGAGNLFGYAIMKETTPSSQRTLLRFHVALGMKQENFEVINATDIDKASFFAVGGPFDSHLYYAVDDKVYRYDIQNKLTTEVLNLQGREITMLKFWNNDHIVVGSFDQGNGFGTVTRYKPADDNGFGPFTVVMNEGTDIPISYGPESNPPCYFKRIVDVINK